MRLPSKPGSRGRELAIASFVGQEAIKKNLGILVLAARMRGEAAPHLLLSGATGMGKTMLARLIAKDLGADVTTVPANGTELPGDFAAMLTNMHANGVLLLEQVESLRRPILDVLIPAAQDFTLEITIGKGSSSRNFILRLPHFTLIGTSLRPQMVDGQLKDLLDHFPLVAYDDVELSQIISNAALAQHLRIDPPSALLIARESDGCPAESLRILKRVRDYSTVHADGGLTEQIVSEALGVLVPHKESPFNDSLLIPDEVKQLVWKRDGGRCVKCGSEDNLDCDYVTPLVEGGNTTARNVQLVCGKHRQSRVRKPS